MTALLEIRNLEKSFGDRVLFHIDRWVIEKGRATILTGSNGAGKSTLLRILAGLEPAKVGHAIYDGRDVSLYPYPVTLRREIVYMHQHPIMFDASLVANVAYGLVGSGLSRMEINERVEEAISWAGIAHLRERPAIHLSGGEKQRVALARARVVRPALLLLDEPTANLDGAAREQVLELIPTLVEQGRSLVIASHERELMDLPQAEKIRLADCRLTLQFEHEAMTA